ncbi:hypothetical protein ABT084_32915 [Streptomyces sp. NPDC002138]|uniref:hypothetical protein n=1 Tax=Streptomyces sp. NPDC002138 TaxID=3154410 RepID=UPI003318F616
MPGVGGYRYTEDFLNELERAVAARVRRREEVLILDRAGRLAHALVAALEGTAGELKDPPSVG